MEELNNNYILKRLNKKTKLKIKLGIYYPKAIKRQSLTVEQIHALYTKVEEYEGRAEIWKRWPTGLILGEKI